MSERTLSKSQKEFLELALGGCNLFLTGKAGTGKSFIIKKLISELKSRKKKVIALAPTGIAANNVGGQTIHSMFSIQPFGILVKEDARNLKSEKRRILNMVDVIIIDEVSMLRPDILDIVHWTLEKNRCGGLDKKQIIFVGDMKQLPVVLDDNAKAVLYQKGYERHDFFGAIIYPSLNISVVELQEVIRQSDPEFIENLNIIREGGKSSYFRQFVTDSSDGIVLAPHNSTVKKYNEEGLASVESKMYTLDAKVDGNVNASDFNVESEIKVKDGCKIMYLVNSQENPLRNGTLGEFVVKGDCFFIRVLDVQYKLDKFEFTKKEYVFDYDLGELVLKTIGTLEQYPFKLAYALSIHKSQGLTFDEVTVDLTMPCFQQGQMYVALSRVKSPKGLRIITR